MKRSPLKRKSKSTRAKLYAELDAFIKAKCRSGGRCHRCGGVDNLQAHHIIRVSQSTFLRWDIRNLICLCRDCHYLVHNRLSYAEEWDLYHKVKPALDIEFVEKNIHTPGKFSMKDLRMILEDLRGEGCY